MFFCEFASLAGLVLLHSSFYIPGQTSIVKIIQAFDDIYVPFPASHVWDYIAEAQAFKLLALLEE
jgi:hypothetical protein